MVNIGCRAQLTLLCFMIYFYIQIKNKESNPIQKINPKNKFEQYNQNDKVSTQATIKKQKKKNEKPN